MSKKIILTLALLMTFGGNAVFAANPFNYDLQKDMNRTRDKKLEEQRAAKAAKEAEARGETVPQQQANQKSSTAAQSNPVSRKLEFSEKYYPNANMPSAIKKYKNGNYTGCLQELYSLTEKDPSNPIAYYYMAMAYSQIGDKNAAIAAYEKVIGLSSNDVLTSYATRGKACLSGDAVLCHPEVSVSSTGEVVDELDAFIAAPYGNGFSDELNEEMKQKELNRIQHNINNNADLQKGEFRRIKELETPDAPADLESKKPTKEEVLAALHNAQCDDILNKFPQGVDTVIGSKGVYLSGGEQQRIAIARVMLKNAPVLVLDEATAFADPENEAAVQRAFERLAEGRTVIMIAHRLTTVQNADNIYVLKDGKVAESGTHAQLMEQNGLYHNMYDEYRTSIAWKVGGAKC